MWLAQLIGMGAITGVMAFLPLYIPHLGVTSLEETEMWSGLLIGIASFCAAIAGPYWGAKADRSGRKLLVERVMLMFGIVMICMSLVTNVYQLLILRMVQGFFGGFTASAMALVTSVTPDDEIGFTMGMFQTAMIAGGAVGPMFGGLIADHMGYRQAFVAFGLLCLLALVIIHFAVTEHFTPIPQKAKPSISKEIRTIISIPGLGSMLLVQFLIQFAIQVVGPVLPLYVQTLEPSSPYIATICGTIVAIAGITSAIASAGVSRLAKRFNNKSVLIVASGIAAFFFVLQALATNVLSLGILRGLAGLCLGAMLPTSNTIITFLIPPERRGVAYGVTTGAMQMGNVIGPLSGGVIALSFTIPSVFWVTAILFTVVSVWVGLRVREPQYGSN